MYSFFQSKYFKYSTLWKKTIKYLACKIQKNSTYWILSQIDQVISQGRNSWEIIDVNVGLYYQLLVHIQIFEIKILNVVNLRYSHAFDCVLQTFWIFFWSYAPINICKPQSKACENLQFTTFISKNWKWTKNPLWSISKVISTTHYNRNSLCLQCSP